MADSISVHHEGKGFRHAIINNHTQLLPPIGVFWDIENCQVPKGKSALATAQLIRKKFFENHREAEFMCVCDISKESKEVIQELNNAQVTVVHINATGKNAADDKLRQSMRRFADIHGSPSTIILISGDVNFAADLSDFNHRRHIHIIVLHNNFAPEPLLACAHEHCNFAHLLSELPFRTTVKLSGQQSQNCELLVTKLPMDHSTNQIRSRLKQLSDNCGGRVISVSQSTAVIRFPTPEAAQRAKKRMTKEDVYGSKISVNFPSKLELGDSIENLGSTSPDANGAVGGDLSFSPAKYGKGGDFPPPPTLTACGTVFNSVWKSQPSPNLQCIVNGTMNSNFESAASWQQRGIIPVDNLILNSSPSISGIGPSIPSLFEGFNGLEQTQRRLERQENIRSHLKASRTSRRRVKSIGQMIRSNGLHAPGTSSGRSQSRSVSPMVDDMMFQPIACAGDIGNEQVDLLVTNLDQTLEINALKEILLSIFQDCVTVVQLNMVINSEGNVTAVVTVPSMYDAQYAISQLHRQKVGFRRIIISLANSTGPSLSVLKSQVHLLLLDVPCHSLPLFKLRELFERRYHQSITVSDLNKMKDLCFIQDNSKGRLVILNEDYRNTPSPACSEGSKEVQEIMEKSFCEIHCSNPNDGKGWAEKSGSKSLPDVRISLKQFGPQLRKLLLSHDGSLPLGSFLICYKHEFGPLASVTEGGIPLEHLIACVNDVGIVTNATGSKRVKFLQTKPEDLASEFRTISPPLAPQLALFSREIVDLLKNCDNCLMAFVKFIPAYHHHFGRQCRVADYGFTKLIELLDAISHIVQIIGEGNKRLITLTHRSQMKRFTSDLLRILKSQASKQLLLKDFSSLYSKCFNKEFKVTNYGACELRDLLDEIPEHTIMVTGTDEDLMISIPRRDQTPVEIERTKKFGLEVLELLRQSPQCQMAFQKFIPAYHHHFAQQCRVSDYGFTKLHELFEAIPHIVKIHGEGDEKVLILEDQELLKVLSDQITTLVKSSAEGSIPLIRLMKTYTQCYGHGINLDDFQVSDEFELLSKIKHVVQVVDSSGGPLVKLADSSFVRQMCFNARRILMEHPDGSMTTVEFSELFLQRYSYPCNIVLLGHELMEFLEFDNNGSTICVRLRPLQLFARNVHLLLHDHNGRICLSKFEDLYQSYFQLACSPADLGFSNLISLIQAIPEVAHMRGKGSKKVVYLNREFLAGSPLHTLSNKIHNVNEKLENKPKDELEVDLLSIPVPSCIPSPSIEPNRLQNDLISFDTPLKDLKDTQDFNGDTCDAVMQNSLETVLQKALNLSLKNACGVVHPVSAQNSETSSIPLKLEVQQLLSPSLQVTSIPTGNVNHIIFGGFRNEAVACKSCENLMASNDCLSTSEVCNSSSQSTPTHQSQSKIRGKSRIAANFSQKVGL